MSGWIQMFGKRDARQTAREAIISLRQQLVVLEKKEEHIEQRVEEELTKAKMFVAAKKTASAAASLRRKNELGKELDRLCGTRLTLETQLNALESAQFNAQTFAVISNSQRAFKQIHRDLNVDKVDSILEDMREQIENAQVVQQAISTPLNGDTIDEEDLLRELAELEQETLDERLSGANTVPTTQPARIQVPVREEEDEDEQLRQLQASLAM